MAGTYFKPHPVRGALRLVADSDGGAPKLQTLSDEQLVSAVRAYDPAAPTVLWNRYVDSVRRLLIRALGPGNEIEDLTQEVFLRLFVRIPSLRDPSALRSFVFAVAANVLKWEIRRRWVSRRVRLSVTGTLPEIEGSRSSPEARQALRRCYDIFDSLAAKERLAFVFRLIEGMTTEEVAEALSVSTSTAKRLVGKACAKVAEKVGGDIDLKSFFVVDRFSGFGEG